MSLSIYRSRLNAIGESSSDGVVKSTKQTVNNNFSNSLFSELVLIDDIQYEVIVTQEKKSEDKKILLKPDTKINTGSVVKIKDLSFLTMDFLGEGINEIYPTAKLKLCNSTFPIQSDKTQVLLTDANGNPILNDFGEEQYEWVDGVTENVPCIVETKGLSADTNEPINLPEGRLNVVIPYKEHPDIVEGKQFTMYGSSYQIIGIDYTKSVNKKGILTLQGKKV